MSNSLRQTTTSTTVLQAQPCYSFYGLTVQSELPLPQLLPQSLPGKGGVDVTIRQGSVPTALAEPVVSHSSWQTNHSEFLFTVPDVGSYWVHQGKEIVFERDPQADDDDIRAFLLGSAFGVILHQRQIWALHASAIKTQRGAVLFTGDSGMGKSTTLNGFLQRGYSMLADDVSGITLNAAGTPQVLSAFPHSRLWANTAKQLNLSTAGVPRVRQCVEKFLFPIDNFDPGPTPLHAVYVLGIHNKPDITLTPVEGIRQFSHLLSNTYRQQFVQAVGWGPGHFQLIAQALPAIKVVQVFRPHERFCLSELIEHIEADFNLSY